MPAEKPESIQRTIAAPRRIVLATDLGADSVDLFAHGLSLALRSGAELCLVHILDDERLEASWRRLPTVRTLLERWGVLPPSATPEQFEALGIRVHRLEYRPIDADLPTALVRRISMIEPDLLLLGTHVRSWLGQWTKPSVSAPVARAAHLPTLHVSDRAQGLVDPETGMVRARRVVVPVTTEVPQQRMLGELVRLLEALQAGPVQFTFVHTGSDGTLPQLALPAHRGWTQQVDRRQGSVMEQILEAAVEHDADLIAMATQGHDTWLDALQGSTTERVLQRAHCPVFSVPV